MYAVVSSGGKQYRVEAGSELVVERLTAEAGSTVTFDRVLLVGDGEAVTVGTPTVQGASVSGTVLGEVRGPKLIVFKFKQKATYRRKNGHRQHLTRVRIDEISGGGKRGAKASPSADTTDTKSVAAATTSESKPKATRKSAAKPKAADKAESADTKPKATRKSAAKPKAADKAEE
jgi:large subunit ribosomal protein L21